MSALPPARPGTALRILATTDLGAAFVPVVTSFGQAGTCAGMAALLAAERARQPTIWLDAGDLAVGPVQLLLGRRPWPELAELPLAAAAVGNHEFDDGVPALRAAARLLPFPLLCADVDAGLPASAVVDTDAGAVGVVGLTHPASHRFAGAPERAPGWSDAIGALAGELRTGGARWVVGIVHDGVDWWPEPGGPGRPLGTRVDRLAASVAPWATAMDLILGGHTPGAWTGMLHGVPAAHPHIFAASVAVVDLPAAGRPVIRGVYRIPAIRPDHPSPATDALDRAAATVVGHNRHTWIGRTGADRYLPDLIASALRTATAADAAVVPASQHATQGAWDGAVAALPAGPVTELDLARLFGSADDRPALVRLRPHEFPTLIARLGAVSDPRSAHADHIWWNWCRMPNGVSAGRRDPHVVAVAPFAVPRLAELLNRDLDHEPADVGARQALLAALT
jgi:2',3'-cyclic-nucleotide 2'-phosphodiesterase (5'-nucleotidase family)